MSEPIVSSLAKALRVLECFTVSEPELGVTEISKKLGIGKSNAHNIISTYCQMGYLQQLPNRKYTLGYKLLEHAFIINQHLGYPHAVYDLLLEAAERTGQVVYFGIPYETDVLYLYVAHPIARMKELPYREICGAVYHGHRQGDPRQSPAGGMALPSARDHSRAHPADDHR